MSYTIRQAFSRKPVHDSIPFAAAQLTVGSLTG